MLTCGVRFCFSFKIFALLNAVILRLNIELSSMCNSLSFFTAVLSGWISAPIFSPSAWRQTLGRSRDSAVCSPRLLKDMMDASLKDPFCHPDAQLESGRLQPTTPDRKVGGQHQSPSGPHWLCLPVQSTGPPWEKQLRKVRWWCSTC